jgi:signal peptidase I
MDASNTIERARKPWLAVLLSVAATGLGHLYCGRLTKGLALFFLSFAFAPVLVALSRSASSTTVLVLMIGSLALMFAVFLYAMVDAGLLARRTAPSYRLKEYNHWLVYILFIVVSIGYPTNMSLSIKNHVLQAYKIPSVSMAPSFLRGDRIFLNKAVYQVKAPERGDAVIFVYPDDRHLDYLKRIIALPGDTIQIRNNVVWVNGQPLPQHAPATPPQLNFKPAPSSRLVIEQNGNRRYPILIDTDHPQNMAALTVPHGFCFVLGDNRAHSKDSRAFGPVPLSDVKGRVDYIYWPAASWSRFGSYQH